MRTWTTGTTRCRCGSRYDDSRADRTAADERALEEPQRSGWTPEDAALAAVAGTLGLLATPRERAGEELLAHTGPVRWLVDLVVEEVDRAITRGRSMQGAVGFAVGSPG